MLVSEYFDRNHRKSVEEFRLIHDDQVQDMESSLRRKGANLNDFEIVAESEPLPSGGVFPIRGHVMVKCLSTKKSRKYNASNGTDWFYEFDRDLTQGLFD